MRLREPLEDRFWRRVNKTDGCWEWSGYRGEKGYGYINRGGRHAGLVLVHRLSWELCNGQIPVGLCVLHRCDNPPCVRPDHLFLGTKADNNRDMDEKGRRRASHRPGEMSHRAVLTNEQAKELRELYATRKWTQPMLGDKFGIDQTTVSLIVRGKHYQESGGPVAAPKTGGSLLNEPEVRNIKKHLQLGIVSMLELAELYGVSPSTISKIKNENIWRHVNA